ncbi:helix-turn-helix domain-containing protein [Sinorhizobium garamanticum]|uniref:Helix-turn-helix domain-containing protein n=1 Tax=Sinorhizobium garamanticum TaxID=680247 RepID=A0ABY8DCT0_9HYPH|nr:helix-turn-helix domain-containing protein [Sinorhizobium garamanticum]WEX86656.1 helix-turn-helix domain-containing protein [Sinorhizobium garamanticum]WEX86662.1 helix-turn-helix domain-containing protein [Sinorhizobium garamanticum]WEX88679.1 helix-turn-helix domain-containing protein [Sinorhizobium garamanticum]
MVWRETGIMDERLKFVGECLEGEETMTALCAAYGISRKTGYKWLGRYRALGPQGLLDLPRAPLAHGRATPEELVARIVAEKEARPLWGPKKVLARLQRTEPQLSWPAASTVGEILKRHGLVGRRRGRWRAAGTGALAPVSHPNAVWSGDYKGWFRTRDGRRCEPLTVMDAASRYVLALEACATPSEAEAWPVFERLFKEHGLPDRFRSDNGSPFAATGVTGLTPLAVRFIKLGIGLERITPGRPQQNGRHERFHLTMLPLAATPEADQAAQQAAFDAFRKSYNDERPHEALAMAVPATQYRPSPRRLPDHLPEPDYPAAAAVRRVRSNGEIKWNGDLVYVAGALAGEAVAIEENQEGTWTLRFHTHPLGIIDRKTRRLVRPSAVQPRPAGAGADTAMQGGEV